LRVDEAMFGMDNIHDLAAWMSGDVCIIWNKPKVCLIMDQHLDEASHM